MKAMIMAAGFGTRLLPLTEVIAKPSVPVANRPIMEHVVRLLRHHGITDIACNLHYHPDGIRAHFGDGRGLGVHMRYILEQELSGTAGGVGKFREHLEDGTFLVMSADSMTDVDLTSLLVAHKAHGGIATIAAKSVDDPSLYGVIVHDEADRITGFQEKPSRDQALSHLCNCGIYVFEPEIFRHISPGSFVDFAKDVFPALLAEDDPFYVWRCKSYWNDVGNLDVYRSANIDALSGAVLCDLPGSQAGAGLWLGAGTEPEPHAILDGPVVAGAGCTISACARLVGPVAIGNHCIIGRNARVDRAVVWDSVKIGDDTQITGCVLGRRVVVGDGAIVADGAVVADECTIAPGAIVPAGTLLPPHTSVPA